MPGVEFAQGLRGIERLQREWGMLYDALPTRSHAQSHGWVMQQLRCLEADPEAVHVAMVRDAGETVAIVPLRYAPHRKGPFQVASWNLLWDPHVTLPPVLLAPGEDWARVIEAIMADLSRVGRPCDQIVLPGVLDEDSWRGVWAKGGLPTLVSPGRQSLRFNTTSADSALASISPHFRKNLARQRRKLASLGAVDLELAIGPEDAANAFEAFLEIEASGWKGAAGTGSAIRLDPNLVRFYSGLIGAVHPRQQVWIATLSLDGRPVASNFCIRTDDTLAVLKIGYDESLRQAAPGNVLLAMLLEACAADPEIAWVSLVTGPAWAEQWRPQEVPVLNLTAFAPTLRGRAFHALARARRALGRLRRKSITNLAQQ